MNTYNLDATHSSANFSLKHMMIAKVHGGFKKLNGTLKFDKNDLAASSLIAEIDAASIDTKEAQRDAHLRSADFFDVEKFPLITFKSTSFSGKGDEFLVKGDLTIHGVTRSIELKLEGLDAEMKDPYGNIKVGASGTAKINRKDFGLTWNAALETGGILVGEDVNISIDVQFAKA